VANEPVMKSLVTTNASVCETQPRSALLTPLTSSPTATRASPSRSKLMQVDMSALPSEMFTPVSSSPMPTAWSSLQSPVQTPWALPARKTSRRNELVARSFGVRRLAAALGWAGRGGIIE
jgi:hypothetical protein